MSDFPFNCAGAAPPEATMLGGPPPKSSSSFEDSDPAKVMAKLEAAIAADPLCRAFVHSFGLSFGSKGGACRLGGGYYADVYLVSVVGAEKVGRLFSGAHQKKEKEMIALKIVDQGRCPKASNYAAELAVCRKVQTNPHPNLVTILHLESFTSSPSGQLWLLMADAGRYHLASFLAKVARPQGRLPESQSAQLFSQLVAALEHLHHRLAVVHRDLKPENVMISVGKKGKEKGEGQGFSLKLKLIDFGFAALIEDPPEDPESKAPVALCTSHKGSLEFMAPELLAPCLFYDAVKSDLYSLGALLYFTLHGVAPFVVAEEAEDSASTSALSVGALIDRYRRLKVETALCYPLLERGGKGGNSGGKPKKKSAVSNGAQALMNSLMAVKPEDRPPLSAVLKSQWLAEKCAKQNSSSADICKSPSTESF